MVVETNDIDPSKRASCDETKVVVSSEQNGCEAGIFGYITEMKNEGMSGD